MKKETTIKRRHKGVITSIKMDKTAMVSVTRAVRHAVYGKNFKRTKKYPTDTAGKKYEVGMDVTIEETRPLSKTKRWRIVN